jgi:hypothetical protein
MAKVKIAWKTNDGLRLQQAREVKSPELIGFQEIACHITIFDVKMEFTRKRLDLLSLEVIRPQQHRAQ